MEVLFDKLKWNTKKAEVFWVAITLEKQHVF